MQMLQQVQKRTVYQFPTDVSSLKVTVLKQTLYIKLKFIEATMSHYIIQSGKNSRVSTDFAPSLDLDGPYEIALQSLESYYSFPNVDEKNNQIHVTLDGTTWYNLTFAVGC